MNPVTITLKKWLREQLIQLVNVQRCSFGQGSVSGDPVREADIVVYTWAGVIIMIHLIDEPIKAPKIRRILENTTSAGIATLFMLDAELLPRPGERIEGDKWYKVFQQLANERIYTYRVGKNGPEIRPAQFITVTRTEFELRYGPAIPIQQIRYLRQTVKHAALKGYWLIADFETERSARNPAFRFTDSGAQPQQSRQQTVNGKTAAPEQPQTAKTKLDVSYEMLGIPRTATRAETKAAFRKLAFEVHPDVSQLPKAEAEARFKLLSEAYEYIKVTNSWI
jgi:hypothetical protein